MTRHERRAVADQEAKGFYASNDGKTTRVFLALEWLIDICLHTSRPFKNTLFCHSGLDPESRNS
ncbi:MAG: hypothetical protein WC405_14545 [Syntrophales bacterium]